MFGVGVPLTMSRQFVSRYKCRYVLVANHRAERPTVTFLIVTVISIYRRILCCDVHSIADFGCIPIHRLRIKHDKRPTRKITSHNEKKAHKKMAHQMLEEFGEKCQQQQQWATTDDLNSNRTHICTFAFVYGEVNRKALAQSAAPA